MKTSHRFLTMLSKIVRHVATLRMAKIFNLGVVKLGLDQTPNFTLPRDVAGLAVVSKDDVFRGRRDLPPLKLV